MSRPQQKSTATFRGRHLVLMRDVTRALDAGPMRETTRKILSFGCSSGAECLDLSDVMPDAAIFGCDVDAKALAAARETCQGRATILESGSDAFQEHGPFDAVLALNVFCRHPTAAGLDDVSKVYPFALFDDGMRALDASVRPGGVLALYNGQYCFEDAAISRDYRPFLDGEQARNGWIEKALPSGRRATDVSYTFEGRTFGRAEWTAWLREGGNQKRAMIDGADHVIYRHAWIDPALGEARSTRHALWIKRD